MTEPIKHIRKFEYTCGAQMTLSGTDPAFLDERVALFRTRKCPHCQFDEGDVTIEELDILLTQSAGELAKLLDEWVEKEARKN